MKLPKIASKKTVVIELEPGDCWWCVCGFSSQQPMCDGSHSNPQSGDAE